MVVAKQTHERHGTLDQHWPTLADLSRKGAGVFVTINRTTLRGPRTTENVTEVRAYFCDFDKLSRELVLTNLNRFELKPHVEVQK
jgi:hypothetical protein